MLKKIYCLVFVPVVLLAFGCKDEEQQSNVSATVDFVYGTEQLVYNQEYTYDTDKRIKFELIKFYVSLPQLQNENGKWVSSQTSYYLVDLLHPTMSLGTFPVGNYTAFRFGVGVDDSRNTETDPQAIPATDYPVDHPLNAAADMWWSWASGYIFVKLEGRIDVDNNGSYIDAGDKAFSYHPGVAELFRTINLPKTIQLQAGNQETGFRFDVEKLINGVKLIDQPVAHANGVGTTEYLAAEDLMDNFQAAFE